MGPVFESVCRTFVGRSRHPRLPFRPVRVGEWWSNDSTEQVDVVALGRDGELLVGECKWGSITRADVESLERRRDLLLEELGEVTSAHLAIFAGNQLRDHDVPARIKRREILHFAPDDLF